MLTVLPVYQIIKGNGGFDVIIGNPPYVEYNKKDSKTKKAVSDIYKLEGYSTIDCGNLYAYCFERSIKIAHQTTKIGFIIPSASMCTPRMSELLHLIQGSGYLWSSLWDERPAKLFDGVDQQLCIHLLNIADQRKSYLTRMNHWATECRTDIFKTIDYVEYNPAFILSVMDNSMADCIFGLTSDNMNAGLYST